MVSHQLSDSDMVSSQVICSEIYPTNIRGFCAAWTAVSFGILLNDDVYFDLSKFWQWVMQLLIARSTTLMSENLGWAMFLLFALFNFASVVFTILFIPETVRDYHSIGSISFICLIERKNSGRNGCRVWLHQIRRGFNEKFERVMIEDTAKATEMRSDATSSPV